MSAIREPPLPGETIAGKYRVIRVLGQGGMGVVFEALHERLRQRVAIKVLNPEVAADKEGHARFVREAQVVARLQSIHVVRVLDVDELPNGLPYIVMEYLVGRDLGCLLDERGAAQAAQLPVAEAVDYVQQAALAMVEAHSCGIVHRDIKPANIFLCDLPGTDRKLVKVVDFGISKSRHEGGDKLTATNAAFGTPQYMSPEHVRSTESVDARSDLWSLGVVLYELLAGRPPFVGAVTAVVSAIPWEPVPRLSEFREGLPDALDRTIMTALEKEPARRYQSASELVDALDPFGPEEPASAVLARVHRTSAPDSREVVSASTVTQSAQAAPMISSASVAPPSLEHGYESGGTGAGVKSTIDRSHQASSRRAPTSNKRVIVGIAVGTLFLGTGALALWRQPASLNSNSGTTTPSMVREIPPTLPVDQDAGRTPTAVSANESAPETIPLPASRASASDPGRPLHPVVSSPPLKRETTMATTPTPPASAAPTTSASVRARNPMHI